MAVSKASRAQRIRRAAEFLELKKKKQATIKNNCPKKNPTAQTINITTAGQPIVMDEETEEVFEL